MKSSRFKLLSFDLDGTLVDTAAEIAEAANRTLEGYGFARQPVAAITLFIGAGARELMRRLIDSLGGLPPGRQAEMPAVLDSFATHYAATAGSECRPYPGCDEALARLRAGGVRLACLTNKEERYARVVLRATGLAGAFEIVVGGDTLAFKKPDPRTVAHIAAALGVALADLAHVGDSRTDVETARRAGVAAWAVPWGYNGGEPVATAAPDRIFESFAAIADAVLAGRGA